MMLYTRDCGCAWYLVPREVWLESAPAHIQVVHEAYPLGDWITRFVHRCTRYEPMCRSLEPWELEMTGERVHEGHGVAADHPGLDGADPDDCAGPAVGERPDLT